MPWSDARVSGARGFPPEPRQHVVELPAGADPELGEHLVQVPLDGAGAEVELRADLGVRAALAGQPRDELLLGRELVARLGVRLRTFAPWRAARAGRARRTRRRPSTRTRRVRPAQLLARVDATALTAQPLAEEQPRCGRARDAAACAPAGRSPRGTGASAASPSVSSARARASSPAPTRASLARACSPSRCRPRAASSVFCVLAGGLDQLAERPRWRRTAPVCRRSPRSAAASASS